MNVNTYIHTYIHTTMHLTDGCEWWVRLVGEVGGWVGEASMLDERSTSSNVFKPCAEVTISKGFFCD